MKITINIMALLLLIFFGIGGALPVCIAENSDEVLLYRQEWPMPLGFERRESVWTYTVALPYGLHDLVNEHNYTQYLRFDWHNQGDLLPIFTVKKITDPSGYPAQLVVELPEEAVNTYSRINRAYGFNVFLNIEAQVIEETRKIRLLKDWKQALPVWVPLNNDGTPNDFNSRVTPLRNLLSNVINREIETNHRTPAAIKLGLQLIRPWLLWRNARVDILLVDVLYDTSHATRNLSADGFQLSMDLLMSTDEDEELTWLAELPHLQHTNNRLPAYPEQITIPDSLCDYDHKPLLEAATFDQWARIRLAHAINYHDHILRDYAWAFQLPEVTFHDAPVDFEVLRDNKLFRPANYGQEQSLGDIPLTLKHGLGREIGHITAKDNGWRYLVLLADDAMRLTMEGMSFESKNGQPTNPDLLAEGFSTAIDFVVEDIRALASLAGALLDRPGDVADALVTGLLETRQKLIEDPVGTILDGTLTDKPGKVLAGGIETIATMGVGAGAARVASWSSKQLLATLAKHLPELAERMQNTMAILNPRRALDASRYSKEVREMLRLAESNPDEFAKRFTTMQERLAREVRENMLDDLTGALSRRAMNELGPKLIDQARRSGHKLVVATFDIDNFKVINEALGHIEGGDDALKQIVRIIQENTRAGDALVRLEGNYAAMLPDQNDLHLPTFRTSKKGDEFLVLAMVKDEGAEQSAKVIVDKVTGAVAQQYAAAVKQRILAAFNRASELVAAIQRGEKTFAQLSEVDQALVRLADRTEFLEWRRLAEEGLVGQISMAASVAEPGSARSLPELAQVFETAKKRADDMLGEVKNGRKAAAPKTNAISSAIMDVR